MTHDITDGGRWLPRPPPREEGARAVPALPRYRQRPRPARIGAAGGAPLDVATRGDDFPAVPEVRIPRSEGGYLRILGGDRDDARPTPGLEVAVFAWTLFARAYDWTRSRLLRRNHD